MLCPKLKHIYHAASGQVVGLANTHTLAIMHADTNEEIVRCDVSPLYPLLKKAGSGMVGKLAWSSSGSMLAVAIINNPPEFRAGEEWYEAMRSGALMAAEVHVYSTATGRCLQSVAITASDIFLRWSPGMDQLAVGSYRECWPEFIESYAPGADQASADDGLPKHAGRPFRFLKDMLRDDDLEHFRFEGQIRLLSPIIGGMKLMASPVGQQSPAQWSSCKWSPGGHLLTVVWESNALFSGSGFKVLDPSTLEVVFESFNNMGIMSWAAQPRSMLRGACLSACFPWCDGLVRFDLGSNGKWQVKAYGLATFQPCQVVHVSPDGNTLVGLRDKGWGQCDLYHHSIGTGLGDWVNTSDQHRYSHGWHLDWAPTPEHWPQLYAHVNQMAVQRQTDGYARATIPSVSLVSAQKDCILGTWTPEMLSLKIGSQDCEDEAMSMRETLWSPNSQHLAVFCGKCILVMTF